LVHRLEQQKQPLEARVPGPPLSWAAQAWYMLAEQVAMTRSVPRGSNVVS